MKRNVIPVCLILALFSIAGCGAREDITGTYVNAAFETIQVEKTAEGFTIGINDENPSFTADFTGMLERKGLKSGTYHTTREGTEIVLEFRSENGKSAFEITDASAVNGRNIFTRIPQAEASKLCSELPRSRKLHDGVYISGDAAVLLTLTHSYPDIVLARYSLLSPMHETRETSPVAQEGKEYTAIFDGQRCRVVPSPQKPNKDSSSGSSISVDGKLFPYAGIAVSDDDPSNHRMFGARYLFRGIRITKRTLMPREDIEYMNGYTGSKIQLTAAGAFCIRDDATIRIERITADGGCGQTETFLLENIDSDEDHTYRRLRESYPHEIRLRRTVIEGRCASPGEFIPEKDYEYIIYYVKAY